MSYNRLYFFFLILGLYAATPLLRVYVGRADGAVQWLVAVVILALVSCGIPQNAVPMNAFTRFIPFVGYFLRRRRGADSARAVSSPHGWLGAFTAYCWWMASCLTRTAGSDGFRRAP